MWLRITIKRVSNTTPCQHRARQRANILRLVDYHLNGFLELQELAYIYILLRKIFSKYKGLTTYISTYLILVRELNNAGVKGCCALEAK